VAIYQEVWEMTDTKNAIETLNRAYDYYKKIIDEGIKEEAKRPLNPYHRPWEIARNLKRSNNE
jgi:hypothetical protein